jgi:hypothetical protein
MTPDDITTDPTDGPRSLDDITLSEKDPVSLLSHYKDVDYI